MSLPPCNASSALLRQAALAYTLPADEPYGTASCTADSQHNKTTWSSDAAKAYAASLSSKRRTNRPRHASKAVGRPTRAALSAHALPTKGTHSLECSITQVGRSGTRLCLCVCCEKSLLLLSTVIAKMYRHIILFPCL